MSLGEIVMLLQGWQQQFHDQIALDLRQLHEGGSWAALGALSGIGFLYGIVHAAGPGHGKVLIGSYMLADAQTLRRGLVITALSSLLQAVVAITLVLALFYGLGLARAQTEYAAAWLECASFALVAGIGAMLVIRGCMALDKPHHTHGPDCGCGHTTPARSEREVWAMIVSIGIRPCSGALLLMFFSCLLGEIWAGMAATLAMAVGTGITTSAIAVAAAQSRRGLLRLVGGSDRRLGIASALCKVVGGGLILALGLFFAYAAWPQGAQAPAAHPLMRHQAR